MLDAFTWYTQASFRWRNGDQTVFIDPWRVVDGGKADLVFEIGRAHV